jgi:hypothetical protein
MSVCELCEQSREQAYSCMKRMEGQIPFGDERQLALSSYRCSDCVVGIGGFHHPSCSIEECPNCRARLLDCVCEGTQDYRSLTGQVWWTRLPRRSEESIPML